MGGPVVHLPAPAPADRPICNHTARAAPGYGNLLHGDPLMTPPSEPDPREREPSETEAAGPEYAESQPADSRFTAGDWILGLFLPLVALATVFCALWYAAFLADPGTNDDGFGLGAGAIGILWYCVFGFSDWARFRKRAAALLIVPLVLSWVCLGFGIHHIAMEYRGVVADCGVRSSETYKVKSESGDSWETAYSLDCGERVVSLKEEADSYAPQSPRIEYGPGGFRLEPEPKGSVHVEYDPRGLLAARTQNIGADPWLWLLASLTLAVIGIGMRILIRPTHRRRLPDANR